MRVTCAAQTPHAGQSQALSDLSLRIVQSEPAVLGHQHTGTTGLYTQDLATAVLTMGHLLLMEKL